MIYRYKGRSRRTVLQLAASVLLAAVTGTGSAQSRRTARRSGAAAGEVCIECLAKRALQRTAFISKWI